MLLGQVLGLLRGIGKHPLALVAQRKIDGGGNFLADGGVSFDLLADGFDRGMGTQKAVGQCLIFTQQPQEQVLGLDVRRAELAGLISCKVYDAPFCVCVSLEHNPFSQIPPETQDRVDPASPEPQKTLRSSRPFPHEDGPLFTTFHGYQRVRDQSRTLTLAREVAEARAISGARCNGTLKGAAHGVPFGKILSSNGTVIKVVTNAITTIMEKRAGEMIFRSRPILRITNSIRPRVFINVPRPAASRQDMPLSRAAAIDPPNFPPAAARMISPQ